MNVAAMSAAARVPSFGISRETAQPVAFRRTSSMWSAVHALRHSAVSEAAAYGSRRLP